jgi:hypothetical protein
MRATVGACPRQLRSPWTLVRIAFASLDERVERGGPTARYNAVKGSVKEEQT